MPRKTVTTHPDGSKTVTTTQGSFGRLLSFIFFGVVLLFVMIWPAKTFGVKSIPIYLFVILLFIALAWARVRQLKSRNRNK